MRRLFPITFFLVGVLSTATFSGLQDRPAANVGAFIEDVENVESVDPLTQKLNELAERFPDSYLKKRYELAGSTRLLLMHFDKPLKIIARENGEIEVRWTREFSADDIDGLADNHPELLKFAEAFPREIDNQTRVKLKIETEVTYKLDNERDFEAEHPELCEIYRAFKTAPLGPLTPETIAQLASMTP